MGQTELTAIFKLVNSPENKRILDENKGDIQRAVSGLNIPKSSLEMLKALSPAARSAAIAQYPDLKKVWETAGSVSGKSFSDGFKKYGMASLPALFSKQGFAAPKQPDWLNNLFTNSGKAKIPDELKHGANWLKLLMGGATAMFNPWISSRLLSDAVQGSGGSGGGKGGSIARGIFGAGGAMRFAEFYNAINVLKTVISKLTEVVKGAIEKGYSLYTGAAQQGLNTQFFAQRSIVAGILGVSGNPNQVFMYGAAFEKVSQQLKGSIETISKNARPLAEVEMNAKMLGVDFEALASDIAVNLAPAIDKFIAGLDVLIKWLDSHGKQLEKTYSPLGWVTGTKELGLVASLFQRLGSLSAGDVKGAIHGVNPFGDSNRAGGIPSLQLMMKQLPASHLEKMGLVIGGGMADRAMEYQRRAAVGIERIYTELRQANKQKSAAASYMGRSPGVAGY